MKLHLLGLPHTVTSSTFSHCAFTGKVKRFSPMMRSRGFHVVHYGVEGAESGADEQVDVMSRAEQESLIGVYEPSADVFVGDVADTSSGLYVTFNARLRRILASSVEKGDIICFPFGHAHEDAVSGLRHAYWLETGIGYPTSFAEFKVFESQAWYHWHLGRGDESGHDYNWVIPNYYDVREWEPSYEPGEYLLYFGRICEIKGLEIVVEIAKHRPDLSVVLCGQGDPTPYLRYPNISYKRPVWGAARSALLRRAIATLCPSRYVEPFGGVAVESLLCGTPVLASSFGAFTETVSPGVGGFLCRTLGDWLAGVEQLEEWGADRRAAARRFAEERYDMLKLAVRYEEVIQQLVDLDGRGWYSRRSTIGEIRRAIATPFAERPERPDLSGQRRNAIH